MQTVQNNVKQLKGTILSARVYPEFGAAVDIAADVAGKKRGDFIVEAIEEKIERMSRTIPWKAPQKVLETIGTHREIILLELLKAPATKFELAKRLGWDEHWVSPRITELRKRGRAFTTGEYRINPHSGRPCHIWTAA